jgi:inosose dehydratase
MKNVWIGCGQLTWPRTLSEEQVLAEIAQAGYDGAPAGPAKNRSAQETSALFAKYGLQPAPGYFAPHFWKKEQEAEILSRAREFARVTRALGLSEMYVATGGFNDYLTAGGRTRNQVAGHVQAADGMSDAEWKQFARALTLAGEVTLEEGVASCFHNHVGSVIETRAELDRLFSLVDRKAVFLGPDTGHLAWAGADVVQFCRDYAGSIKTMHLKDADANVISQGVAANWDYDTCVKHGVWTELGRGCIDFSAILRILQEASFSGWLIVETDVTQLPSALESAQVSRAYLKTLGY